MPDATEELLSLSRQLLESIDRQDWAAYARLCDPTLTCFEPEANGHLVAGMDFHHFYFKLEASGRPRQSTMVAPHVRVLGDTAVISYVRLTQRVDEHGVPTTASSNETRVWQRQNGTWRHVHFHRSPG